jgi:O-methyltransferase involved in polyketide biosynthesis
MYLPPDAQDRLFDNITELSAPGSKLATEYHGDSGRTMTQRAQQFNQRWANLGCDIDLSGLSLIGFSASKTMTGTATAPIDTLRRIE